MPNRNDIDTIKVEPMYEVKAVVANNTTLKGAALDLQGYDSAYVITEIGTWAATVSGGLVEVALQHSDDTVDGNFVYIPATELDGDTIAPASTVTGAAATTGITSANATTNDQKTKKTAYLGSKRYLRVVFNCEKTLDAGLPIAVHLHRGRPNYAPVA